VVDLAERRSLAIPVASQVFTLGYFVGLFGFPLIAARAIAISGIGSVLAALVIVASLNVGLSLVTVLLHLVSRSAKRAA